MAKEIWYRPVVGPKEGINVSDKGYFTVSGARSKDRDEAIAITSQASSIKAGTHEIKRVDEIECWSDTGDQV